MCIRKPNLLIFSVTFFAISCSSNNDNPPLDDTGTTTELLTSIFNAANLIEAESHVRLLVQSLNVSTDGQYIREPITKTNSSSESPVSLIAGATVVSFEQQPMQAPDAKTVTVDCDAGGSFFFTGEPASINVDGGEYIVDNCTLGDAVFDGVFSISARVDGFTQTSYTFDNLRIEDLNQNSDALLNGRLIRTSRRSPLLDRVEWIDADIDITTGTTLAMFRNVDYKHSVLNSNPEWLNESAMSVTASLTDGISVLISTPKQFSITDSDSFNGLYDSGKLEVVLGENHKITIDADTGDLSTFSAITEENGAATSDVLSWGDGFALRCSNTTGLSINDAPFCERALQDYGDFLD